MDSIVRQLLPPPDFVKALAAVKLAPSAFQRPALTGQRGVLGKRLQSHLRGGGFAVAECPGDICDSSFMESWLDRIQPDVLFHFAAKVPTFWVTENYSEALKVNAVATAGLAKTCAQRGIFFVYASTSHVYAPSATARRESDPLSPISAYGETKLAGEFAVRRLCARHLIGRIFSFSAEEQSNSYLVPGLIRRLESEREVTVKNSLAQRDILHADDIAFTLMHLAARRSEGTINICAGRPTSVGEIALRVHELLKSRANLILDGAGSEDALYGDNSRLRKTLSAEN